MSEAMVGSLIWSCHCETGNLGREDALRHSAGSAGEGQRWGWKMEQ